MTEYYLNLAVPTVRQGEKSKMHTNLIFVIFLYPGARSL
jgi:hypothetical protein